MGLPWVRLDTGIAHHDKIAALLQHRDGFRSVSVYVFSLAWSGGQGTDGFIPEHVVPLLHGTSKTTEQLETVGLWDRVTAGWTIRNYALRQELAEVTEKREKSRKSSSVKGNCIRWHGESCGCWKDNTDG